MSAIYWSFKKNSSSGEHASWWIY